MSTPEPSHTLGRREHLRSAQCWAGVGKVQHVKCTVPGGSGVVTAARWPARGERMG